MPLYWLCHRESYSWAASIRPTDYRIMRALTNALANDRRSSPIPGLVVQPAFSRVVVLIHLRGLLPSPVHEGG
jgi:hypothetical protein